MLKYVMLIMFTMVIISYRPGVENQSFWDHFWDGS